MGMGTPNGVKLKPAEKKYPRLCKVTRQMLDSLGDLY
jgi:hypothetical protein